MCLTLLLFLCPAAAPEVAPLPPARAASLAWADAKKLPKDEAPFFRYFRVTTAAKHQDDFLVAFCLHLNMLSTQGVIRWPAIVAPGVLRIDVRDYGWEGRLDVWEKLGPLDFVFHAKAILELDATVRIYWPGSKAEKKGRYRLSRKAGDEITIGAVWLDQEAYDGLRERLYTESPIVDAEWFFAQSSRQISLRNEEEGVGYYDWLGLRNRDDFFALTGTDPKVARKVFAEWRAVVAKSGISAQNRQVVAFGAATGKAWGTLDTFKQVGRGNAKRNLRDGEFAHDAEEWIGRLGNGLWVTFLSDKAGVAQASAPDKIGPDDSTLNRGRDFRVHANLSCIRCHWTDKDGLKPIDDWARKTFRSTGVLRLVDYDKKVLLELESQYLRDLDEIIDDERILFSRGVRKATASKLHPKGLTMAAAGKLYAEAWSRYANEDVTLEVAARELGCKPSALKAAIAAHAAKENRGATDLILASFLDGQAITRLEWEDGTFALAMALTLGINPPEIVKKEKKQ